MLINITICLWLFHFSGGIICLLIDYFRGTFKNADPEGFFKPSIIIILYISAWEWLFYLTIRKWWKR